MQLSATFDEQILKSISMDEWLTYCVDKQIKSLEYSPDPSVMPFELYNTLLKKQHSKGIGTTFHVPYFAKQFDEKAHAYDLSYFKTSPLDFKERYDTLYEYIYLSGKETLLTLHGAMKLSIYGQDAYKKSQDATWFAIEYLLNMLSKKNLPLTLCVELCGPKSNTYLTSRAELIETIEKFKYSPVKICWDMTHDFSRNMTLETPSKLFSDAVKHVHIHGIDENSTKHISLEKSKLNIKKIMTLLKEIGYEDTLVLELLIHTIGHPKDYLKILGNNLEALSKAL